MYVDHLQRVFARVYARRNRQSASRLIIIHIHDLAACREGIHQFTGARFINIYVSILRTDHQPALRRVIGHHTDCAADLVSPELVSTVIERQNNVLIRAEERNAQLLVNVNLIVLQGRTVFNPAEQTGLPGCIDVGRDGANQREHKYNGQRECEAIDFPRPAVLLSSGFNHCPSAPCSIKCALRKRPPAYAAHGMVYL